ALLACVSPLRLGATQGPQKGGFHSPSRRTPPVSTQRRSPPCFPSSTSSTTPGSTVTDPFFCSCPRSLRYGLSVAATRREDLGVGTGRKPKNGSRWATHTSIRHSHR